LPEIDPEASEAVNVWSLSRNQAILAVRGYAHSSGAMVIESVPYDIDLPGVWAAMDFIGVDHERRLRCLELVKVLFNAYREGMEEARSNEE
jgi:hypothetical protein